MKKIFTLLVLSSLVFQSCNKGPQIVSNKAIDAALLKTIAQKNDSLVEAMGSSNMTVFKAIGSTDFLKHLQASTRNVSWAFRENYVNGKYKVFDQHHVINPQAKNKLEIPSEELGYIYTYVNQEKETFVSLIKLPFIHQDYMLSMVYGKAADGKWKLNEMDLTPLGRYDKTPPDYYNAAKEFETKGLLFDAHYNAGSAVEWNKDIEGNLAFDNQKEMKLYAATLEKKLKQKYTFPKVLKDIKTQPSIVNVGIITAVEGNFPAVYYDTKLPIEDTVALKAEYMSMRTIVPKLYPDCNFNTKYVFYRPGKMVQNQDGQYERVNHNFKYERVKQ